MKRFKIATVAVVAGALVTMAACSGSSSSSSDSSSASGGKSGGTLNVASTLIDVTNFDTSFAFKNGGESMRWFGLQLYDGLTDFNLRSSKDNPDLEGDLAQSWSVNPAGTEYTFKLRSGVKFTDGTPWNADAAIFNIERFTVPTNPYYTNDLHSAASLYIGGIGSATKVDDMTLKIMTAGGVPDSFLLQDLALLPMGSPTAIKANPTGFGQNPVGTGPFEFVSHTTAQSVTMKKNPDYWRGAAKIDQLVVRFIPDQTARAAALKSGEVSFAETVSPDDVDSLKSAGFQLYSNPYSNVYRGVFDTTKKPFNDPSVRLAANKAIDRPTIAKTILGDTSTPSFQTAAEPDPGYDASLNSSYKYDPAAAKKLLADAGYPDGLDVTISYISAGGSFDANGVIQAVQQQWAAVGIRAMLIPLTSAQLFAATGKGAMPGGADVAAWSGTFILPSLWATFVPTSPLNVGKYTSDAALAAFNAAKSATDVNSQTAALTKLNTQATKDAAWLPIVTDNNARMLAKNVEGFIDPKAWFVDLRSITIG